MSNVEFATHGNSSGGAGKTEESKNSSTDSSTSKSALLQHLSYSVWNDGKKKAESVISSYTNIDFLRQFFDVEPGDVVRRLLHSFVPINTKASTVDVIPSEIYGPIMICFTLVALLLYEMKSSGHQVHEGTLMGSALITCFGYWMGISAFFWVFVYLCNISLRPVQINTIIGYGLTGHCVVLLLGTLVHSSSHAFFFAIWLVFGGLCTLRMIFTFSSRIEHSRHKLVCAGLLATAHMAFLLYLHFAYHIVVEEVSGALNSNVAATNPAVTLPSKAAQMIGATPPRKH